MPSRKKRKKPPINLKGVIIFSLLVISLCVYAFFFIRPSLQRGKPARIKPPPVINYRSACHRINQTIFRDCQNLGATDKDFRILQQKWIHKKGKEWIYTRTEVFLPKEADPARAAQDIIERLKSSFNTISFQWNKKRRDRVSLSLWLGDVLTNSLTLIRRLPRLAIIIDDIGENLKTTRAFLALGIPLTLSILPDLAYSKESEELAHKCGYETMLHLPMEPKNLSLHNPGEGAIYADMDKSEIYDTVISDIHKFKYIKGVNNHMGSRITENEQIMKWVLSALKPFGLYFIDSRTSSQSIAYKVAREMGVPTGKNEVFIDNEPEVNCCKNFIDKAILRVKKEGKGIIIGHPRETTLQALREMNFKVQDEGISLVFVSELVQ